MALCIGIAAYVSPLDTPAATNHIFSGASAVRLSPRSTLRRLSAVLFPLSLAAAMSPQVNSAPPAASTELQVFVGSVSKGDAAGIYTFRFHPATGKAGEVRQAAPLRGASFLAIHPNQKFLYAVSNGADDNGAVAAFALDAAGGELQPLNSASTVGPGPCHLVVDRTGKFVLAVNYGGGNGCVLPVKDDGRLGEHVSFIQNEGSGPDARRQKGPHAHSINLDPANKYALIADLGADKLFVFRFDARSGELTPHDPAFAPLAPGAGPRHLAFHPSGNLAYVVNELAMTVTGFQYDAASGSLHEFQTITTLPREVQTGDSTAEVVVHPSGKFLYASNRGHNSIAMFALDPSNGRLTSIGHEPTQGETPRNFAIDPSGQFLFAENQGSDTIVLFRIDPESGNLHATGEVLACPAPVCIKMLPVAP